MSVSARALSPLETKRNATNPYLDDVELRVNGNIVNIVLRIYASLNRLALFNGKRARQGDVHSRTCNKNATEEKSEWKEIHSTV